MASCLCLSCKNEMDCDLSKILRKHQMELLGTKAIWNKVFMTFEVTSCKDYKKMTRANA